MTDVSNVDGASILNQYKIEETSPTEPKDNELGRDEFLELMIAQLENQNPLEPQDNGEFIAELAQFSTLEGIENMANSMEELSLAYKSNQALTATSLVGSSVTVKNNDTSTLRWGEIVYGTADIPAGADDLTLNIKNEYGDIVESVSMGYQTPGEVDIKWDGLHLEIGGTMMELDLSEYETDDDGNPLPLAEGSYSFEVVGSVYGASQAESMSVDMSTKVDSVSINPDNSLVLNLAGGGTTTMADIRKINHVK